MSNNKQSSIEWLHSNNETICEMLLLDKIPKSTYEQLINCFSMNLEHAKAMHKEEIMDAFQEGKWDGWENHKLKVEDKESQWTDPAHYYNETFNTKEK
jgi:hypothetical protein